MALAMRDGGLRPGGVVVPRRKGRCSCPECRRRQQSELTALIDGGLRESEVAPTGPVRTDRPEPNAYYRIQRGDNLYTIAGRAYGLPTGQRLAAARRINDHPYNLRFRDKSVTEKGQFPQGRVSFNAAFSCDVGSQRAASGRAPRGSCLATIWIPGAPLAPTPSPGTSPIHPILGTGIPLAIGDVTPTNLSDLARLLCPPSSSCRSFVRDVDTRKLVPNTKLVPHRWIASIMPLYRLSNGEVHLMAGGTAFAIGRHHLLTAAHVVNFFIDGQIRRAIGAIVAFGHSSNSALSGVRPFGELYIDAAPGSNVIRVPKSWTAGLNSPTNFAVSSDYCLIRHRGAADLVDKLGQRLPTDFWGSTTAANAPLRTSIGEPSRGFSRNRLVDLAGYACDKSCEQWWSRGAVDAVETTRIYHEADVVQRLSGCPVWLEETSFSGGRVSQRTLHLVGIQSANIGGRQVAVRLRNVWPTVQRWLIADGVRRRN